MEDGQVRLILEIHTSRGPYPGLGRVHSSRRVDHVWLYVQHLPDVLGSGPGFLEAFARTRQQPERLVEQAEVEDEGHQVLDRQRTLQCRPPPNHATITVPAPAITSMPGVHRASSLLAFSLSRVCRCA